jgi:hypothetical protein
VSEATEQPFGGTVRPSGNNDGDARTERRHLSKFYPISCNSSTRAVANSSVPTHRQQDWQGLLRGPVSQSWLPYHAVLQPEIRDFDAERTIPLLFRST